MWRRRLRSEFLPCSKAKNKQHTDTQYFTPGKDSQDHFKTKPLGHWANSRALLQSASVYTPLQVLSSSRAFSQASPSALSRSLQPPNHTPLPACAKADLLPHAAHRSHAPEGREFGMEARKCAEMMAGITKILTMTSSWLPHTTQHILSPTTYPSVPITFSSPSSLPPDLQLTTHDLRASALALPSAGKCSFRFPQASSLSPSGLYSKVTIPEAFSQATLSKLSHAHTFPPNLHGP